MTAAEKLGLEMFNQMDRLERRKILINLPGIGEAVADAIDAYEVGADRPNTWETLREANKLEYRRMFIIRDKFVELAPAWKKRQEEG